MDWFAPIDAYCERLSPGLWAEPLNAVSNAGFLLVSVWGLTKARLQRADGAVVALAALVGVIGLGSLAFHTFANGLAMLADVIPIALFIYAYLGFALRRFLGFRWIAVAAGLAGLFLVNVLVEQVTPRGFLNGSAGYLPALAAGVSIAALARRRKHSAAGLLFAAAGIFAASIAVRSADRAICGALPIGTHFLWHLLNAAVLGAYLAAALRFSGPKTIDPGGRDRPGPVHFEVRKVTSSSPSSSQRPSWPASSQLFWQQP
jgi:Ceramidase